MHKLILSVSALVLASAATAQMPLPAFSNTFTSTLTRGFFFQAPAVGGVIQGLEVWNETSQPNQVVEVIDFGAAAPPAYPGTVIGTSMFYDNTSPSGTVIVCNVSMVPGNWYGILGAANPTPASSTSHNSYGLPGAFTSNILGSPVTIARMGTQVGLAASGPNQACWTEAAFNVGRIDVYVGTGGGNFATKLPFGTGCNSLTGTSFYEHFPIGTFDLTAPVDNMTLLHTGGDYLALSGLGTWIAPTAAATPLALGDDSEAAITLSSPMPVGRSGSTNSLMVCSNGFVSTGSNGTGFTPNVNTFLNNGQAGWYCWHDYNPTSAGSGSVVHEEIGGVLVITWDGVHSYGQTVPEYFQFQFDLASGNCTIVWQTISNLGNDHLVGFSEGGASADPGSIDLSTLLPLTIPGAAIFEIVPLGLSADARPVLGTTVTMTVDNVPSGSPFGAVIYGLTQYNPGIDLTSIGMPGCYQYCSQDSVSLAIAPGNSFSNMFTVPTSTSYAGVHIQVQGACYNPTAGLNALGAISSQGVELGLDIN